MSKIKSTVALLAGALFASAASAWTPDKPVEFVVTADVGAGFEDAEVAENDETRRGSNFFESEQLGRQLGTDPGRIAHCQGQDRKRRAGRAGIRIQGSLLVNFFPAWCGSDVYLSIKM